MYINKIDDLIDKVIDDFFNKIILKDQILSKIYKEPNFVKFQKELNTMMMQYIDSISLSEIRELVKSSDAVHSISETLKRYIAFYIFLTIGFNYTSKDDTYINNIIEFTKNQSEYNYKIENFFNSESNALLIKYNNMIKNIIVLLDADKAKIDALKVKPDYRETIIFLNQFGQDYVNKNFRLDSLDGNKQLQAHYIIKTIIVSLLYRVSEKKEFFRLLEMTENLDGEYMFIDIVVPKQQYIDYNAIEKLIGSDATVKNLSYYLWTFFTEHDEMIQKPPLSIEEKIILLIQSGILYPITDDFLLYHKESERYDKSVDPTKIKKKEDTKIRYVVNKIESVSEYYSDQIKKDDKIRNNIKKNFYIPLLQRKAITVNHNEDIHIVNKFLNQGKRSVENNEYFNDLISYKVYPYVNFKDFDTFGFNITLSKTIDIVRYVSVAQTGDFKQNKNNTLQMRVGSKDMSINVVGFMIPTNLSPVQCLRSKDITDIKSLSKNNQNGYDLMVKYLKESTLGTQDHNSSIFWLFDLEKDNVTVTEEYDQVAKASTADQIKHIVSALYDNIIKELYYVIVDKLEKHQNLNLQIANKIVNLFKKKIIDVPQDSHMLDQLEEKIYELVQKIEPSYDTNEDIVYGITGNVINLPEHSGINKPKVHTISVNLSDIGEYGTIEERDTVDGICQHNVTWDRLSSLQKNDPKAYSDQLYNFIQQYVWENVDQEFVCKSCGFQLNIKKYILDGVFDDETQKFITYSMPMDTLLEDIPEYEKYKVTIRNIDKIIEKIAIVSNIPHLTKSSFNVKWQRKVIVKDAIDLILMNNRKLKSSLKERNDTASKSYGINRDWSNLFVFELENSIFVFSSKDKDHYKPIKQNNILTYLTFLIIMEINESQIPFIGGDKKGLCNFQIFEKILHPLFDGLKIRINNKGDVTNITNYKILCYLIYIISCSIIKYNMWYYEYPDPTKKKKYAPIIQKIFVHTIIDIINSVLEFASVQGSHYLYEIVSIKMFKKLTSTFSSEDLYQRLSNDGKTSLIGERKEFIVTKSKLVPLSGKFTPIEYDLPFRITCRVPKFFMHKKVVPYLKYYNINNVTNCPSGQWHEWEAKSGKFICKICKQESPNVQLNTNETTTILTNFRFVRLQDLAVKFCLIDGLLHQFVVSSDKNDDVCMKCNNTAKHIYTHSELTKLESALERIKENQSASLITKAQNIDGDIKKELTYVEKVVNHLTKEYKGASENGKTFKFIDGFLDEIHSTIGNEMGQGSDIFLRENSYIIDHDHLGYNLDKSVVITDNNNKIFYKQNHPFFKTDVIYYPSYKNGKIDVFYDATSKILLGYKEESKNFILNNKHDKRLIVNYSVLNKLKILGYVSKFVYVAADYKKEFLGRENIDNVDKNIIAKSIVMNIIRDRIGNLKKIIYEFQRILYRIINNFTSEPITQENELEYFSNKLNIFIEKYKKKLMNINITNDKGDHVIFKHWKGVSRGFFASDVQEIKYNFDEQSTVNTDDINKIDNSGNTILYFIIEEFIKLLKYNPDTFLKTSICHFIVDFINASFELFNTERISNNIDIKRFEYILASAIYVQEVTEKSGGSKETEGIYSEYKDPDEEVSQEQKDEMYDDKEERDALDIGSDYDYEEVYEQGVEWEPTGEIIYNPNI